MKELVEREAEVALADRALGHARGGEGRALFIDGPAGIGKTALLDGISSRAEAAGFRILRARGSELETGFGFGVARQLFEPLLASASAAQRRRWLAGAAVLSDRPLQADAGSLPLSEPFAAVHGLYWLAVNAAEFQPLMVSIDDAQWADGVTLSWLAYLAHRIDQLPLLMALTVRRGDPADPCRFLDSIRAEAATVRLEPRALSPDGTAQVVRGQLGGNAQPAMVNACHQATAGHPFLLVELIRAIQTEGLERDDGAAALVPTLLPASVSLHTMQRLGRLPEESRAVARSIAVLSPHAHCRHVAALAGLPDESVARGADALEAAGLVSPDRPLAFRHPLILAAIYDSLGTGERRTLHRQAARVLTAEQAIPDLIATHLLRTEPAGDLETVRILRTAATQALGRGAWPSSVDYLRRAMAEPPAEEERFAIHLQLGMAEIAAQDPRCVEHVRQVLCLGRDPVERATAALAFTQTLLFAGEGAAALAVLREAREALGQAENEPERSLATRLDALAIGTAPHALQAEVADRIIERIGVLPAGETSAERALLAQIAWRRQLLGDPSGPLIELARRALAGAALAESGDPISPTLPGIVLMCAGAGDEAEILFAELLRSAQETGGLVLFGWVSALRALLAFREGRLDDAETGGEDALRASATSPSPYAVPVILHVLAGTLLERGRLDEAEQCLLATPPPEQLSRDPISCFPICTSGALQLARGRPEQALETMERVGEIIEGIGCHSPEIISWRGGAALALNALGRVDEARRQATRELEEARRVGTARASGVALRTLALVEEREPGLGLLRESAQTLERSSARLERARTLVELGGALRRANRRAEAKQQLAEALDAAERLGAAALAQQALEELRAAGARPRRRIISGVASLTASEARIARMAAQGLSNARIAQTMFVTTKTVEKHLGNAYGKLEISSRAQLTAALEAPDSGPR